MTSCEMEQAKLEPLATVDLGRPYGSERCFTNLRGVRWRVNLGILPSSASIDDLRRVTAESRRRYAALRRRLLADPHIPKDGSSSPDLAMDNPLSHNPDSTWGRFFHNAKLEKTLDQDLSRLYPEHGSYFQAAGCQGLLRRILLLWCLRHPEYGYRQGMHELLAPFLYVLQVDFERLSEVRKNHGDHFTDRFDGLSFEECDVTYNFDFKKFLDSMEDEIGSKGSSKKVKSLDELDPEIQTIVRLSDAYGPEGELGIVLSEKFMEHDAYCMFDALMSGAHGSIAMADFFAHSPIPGSHTGLPPVLEASAALYHVLSVVDLSLHSHLVELGVEPQYFALRWLRVLFGREFLLQNLLMVWDEIFSADNSKPYICDEADISCSFRIFNSPRGALITGMAVSMILYLRSSLLATETATSCLQRLLNFPENVDLNRIIEKAKSLQDLASNVNISSSLLINGFGNLSSTPMRYSSLPSGSVSPKSPLIVASDSYWEEKWRVLHKAEEEQKNSALKERSSTQTPKGWSRLKLRLSKAESNPTADKTGNGKEEAKTSSVRRNLVKDLSRQLGFDSGEMKGNYNQEVDRSYVLNKEDKQSLETEEDRNSGLGKEFHSAGEEGLITGNAASEGNSSILSEPTSSLSDSNYIEKASESSSGASNLCPDDSDNQSVDSPLPVSCLPSNESPEPEGNNGDNEEKSETVFKDRKFLLGKFQWFWKFGRKNIAAEETSDAKESVAKAAQSTDVDRSKSNTACFSGSSHPQVSSSGNKGDKDQNVMGSLKNLGQSMLEHIQVIESVFQQDRGQVGLAENLSKNGLVEKGQVTAVAALKELWKISNLLSEM